MLRGHSCPDRGSSKELCLLGSLPSSISYNCWIRLDQQSSAGGRGCYWDLVEAAERPAVHTPAPTTKCYASEMPGELRLDPLLD